MDIKVKTSNLILITIITFSVIFSCFQIYMGLQELSVSDNLINAWCLFFAILIAMWAMQDSKNYDIPRLSSFGLLMLVLWPLVLLHHLTSNRGIEGLVLYFGFWALFTAPFFLGLTAYAYS